MMRLANLVNLVIGLTVLVAFLYSCKLFCEEMSERASRQYREEEFHKRIRPENETDLPLIFVGGVPRSGTTLMRTMLESHPDIRCGPETHVISEILLERKKKWLKSPDSIKLLKDSGVHPEALDIAMAKFILEIIKEHAPPAVYYCNKDPIVLSFTEYTHHLFPKAKFVFMVRDGRASAHSIVSRGCKIKQIDTTNYRGVLRFWNDEIEVMNNECKEVGERICLPVYYEQLVLQPVNTTKRIFQFLDIPWTKEVLHHERHVNESGLSKVELSTNQVKKALYLEALTSWFGHIPPDVERDMNLIAPMLRELGYDPDNPRPTYGEPDQFVLGKLDL